MSVETLGKNRTEQLRFWAGNKVKDLLGYSEDTVVTAAIACLGKFFYFLECIVHKYLTADQIQRHGHGLP